MVSAPCNGASTVYVCLFYRQVQLTFKGEFFEEHLVMMHEKGGSVYNHDVDPTGKLKFYFKSLTPDGLKEFILYFF